MSGMKSQNHQQFDYSFNSWLEVNSKEVSQLHITAPFLKGLR